MVTIVDCSLEFDCHSEEGIALITRGYMRKHLSLFLCNERTRKRQNSDNVLYPLQITRNNKCESKRKL